MFTVNSSGDIMGMKKLEYNPSCIHSFSHKGKLLVFMGHLITRPQTDGYYQ